MKTSIRLIREIQDITEKQLNDDHQAYERLREINKMISDQICKCPSCACKIDIGDAFCKHCGEHMNWDNI